MARSLFHQPLSHDDSEGTEASCDQVRRVRSDLLPSLDVRRWYGGPSQTPHIPLPFPVSDFAFVATGKQFVSKVGGNVGRCGLRIKINTCPASRRLFEGQTARETQHGCLGQRRLLGVQGALRP